MNNNANGWNSNGWKTFRRVVPYKVRLLIATPVWLFLLIICVADGAWRGMKDGYQSAVKYWPKGEK